MLPENESSPARASAEELRAVMLLRLLPGLSDRRVARLLRAYGTARRALSLPSVEFTRALGKAAEKARSDPALSRRIEEVVRCCRELGARMIPFGAPDYPESLLSLVDPPPILFARGDLSLLARPAVAIVGSRRATAQGRRTTERIAAEIADRGVVVVSGLALGIDGAAHRGALAVEGGTIAVLGCGPDLAYPASHRALFGEILQEGLIVTEFPPGEPAQPHNFPRRNRILAGLSAGVVVVEAAERSGALITVDHALDLGVEVFAVPGSVEAPNAAGSNNLIRDGAHLVTGGLDVLEVLGWGARSSRAGSRGSEGAPDSGPPRDIDSGSDAPGPRSDLSRVRGALGTGPRPVEELVPEVGFPVPRVLAALTRLELTGAAIRSAEGWRRAGQSR